jgi:hypothetical protein
VNMMLETNISNCFYFDNYQHVLPSDSIFGVKKCVDVFVMDRPRTQWLL